MSATTTNVWLSKRARPVYLFIAVAALSMIVPIFASSGVMTLLDAMCMYGVAGYSVAFLFGYGGQLSLASAALIGVGAYSGGIVAAHLTISPLWAAPIAMAAAAAVAAVIGVMSMRLKGHYLVITTFAVVEVVNDLMSNLNGVTGGSEGIVVSTTHIPFAFISNGDLDGWYYVLVPLLAITAIGLYWLAYTKWGRRLQSIRENEDLAKSLGINTARTKVTAFAISGAVAGLAGWLICLFYLYVSPAEFTSDLSIMMVELCILGGVTVLLGPLVGAFIVVALPGILNLQPNVQQIVLGGLLIVFILTSPNGIVGRLSDVGNYLRRHSNRQLVSAEVSSSEEE
jgi:branched-chain amino acid transport system permease protein